MHRGDRGQDSDRAARAERRRLVREVETQAREILNGLGEPALARPVLRAMLRVPREAFVPQHALDLAYANTALTIGHGQTISQPLIVALMTHLLDVGSDDAVLEIGTGSGYQAAVLSEIVRHVYSVEVVPALAMAARERLHERGFGNVTVRIGDGAEGWPEHAPYDGIIVTAAAPKVPRALVEQLRPGARMVIPLGAEAQVQWLEVIVKDKHGALEHQRVLPVRFVPFTGAGIGH